MRRKQFFTFGGGKMYPSDYDDDDFDWDALEDEIANSSRSDDHLPLPSLNDLDDPYDVDGDGYSDYIVNARNDGHMPLPGLPPLRDDFDPNWRRSTKKADKKRSRHDDDEDDDDFFVNESSGNHLPLPSLPPVRRR